MRFGKRSKDVVAKAADDRQLRVQLPAVLHEAVRFVAAVIWREQIEVSCIVLERPNQGRGKLVILLCGQVRIAIRNETEAIRTYRGGALHVPGLSAKEASTCFYGVIPFRPTDRSRVLESVVYILKGNKRAVTDIREWATETGVSEFANGLKEV